MNTINNTTATTATNTMTMMGATITPTLVELLELDETRMVGEVARIVDKIIVVVDSMVALNVLVVVIIASLALLVVARTSEPAIV